MGKSQEEVDIVLVEPLARVLDGEFIDLDELVEAHHEHADAIRGRFPVLCRLAADLELREGDAGGEASAGIPPGYRLIGPLGSGGQSRVLLVERVSDGQRAALKIWSPGNRSAMREALAFDRLREIAHPAIVKVLSVHSQGLLLEFLKGPSLDAVNDLSDPPGDRAVHALHRALGGGGEPYRKIAGAFAKLARGIQVLHEKHVFHRDFKPANVKVEAQRGLVFLDLGIAKVEGLAMTTDGDIMGTLPFLAPECHPNAGSQVSARTDVYGIAATLYAVLTNRWPHQGETPVAVLEAVLSRSPPSALACNPSLPRGLALVVEKAMARSPGDRYETARGLAEDLERFAVGKQPLAQIGLARLRRRRRRILRLGAAAAAVLLVLGFTWSQLREKARTQEVRQRLALASELLSRGRAPESLTEAGRAASEARGFEQILACVEAEAAALRTMGRLDEGLIRIARILPAQDRHERQRAIVALGKLLADAARYDHAWKMLAIAGFPETEKARDLFTEVGLRLEEEEPKVRWILGEARDAKAQRTLEILDRFRVLHEIPVNGASDVQVVEDADGHAQLCIATPTSEYFLADLRAGSLRAVAYEGPVIVRPRLAAGPEPGTLALAGPVDTQSPTSGGRAVLLRASSGELLREWSGIPMVPRYVACDMDGDGLSEHVLLFEDMDGSRGLVAFGSKGSGEPLALQDLAELAPDPASDPPDTFSLLVLRADPGGSPLLCVGTGPWEEALGYSLRIYRRDADRGFRCLSSHRLGYVKELVAADLDGDGEKEIYAAVWNEPALGQEDLLTSFRPPGVYRLDGAEHGTVTGAEPLCGRPRAGFLVARDVRWSSPVWRLYPLKAVGMGQGHEALVLYSSAHFSEGRVSCWLDVIVPYRGGFLSLPLPNVRPSGRGLAAGDLLPANEGDEVAVPTTDSVLVLGQPNDPAEVQCEQPEFETSGDVILRVAQTLQRLGYAMSAATLFQELGRGEDVFECYLATGDTDGARAVVAGLDDLLSGERDVLEGRILEEEFRFREAGEAYARVLTDPLVGEETRRDAAAGRQGIEALLKPSRCRLEFAFEAWPPAKWRMTGKGGFEALRGGGLRCTLQPSQGQSLERLVVLDPIACEFEFTVVPKVLGFAGGVYVGLFRKPVDAEELSDALFVGLTQHSGRHRDLVVHGRTRSGEFSSSLLTPGQDLPALGSPLTVAVRYRGGELPVVRISCRDGRGNDVIPPHRRVLDGGLSPGPYYFGVRGYEMIVSHVHVTLCDLTGGSFTGYGESSLPPR
jgi:tetratricopeptide (TPR) repeat protein